MLSNGPSKGLLPPEPVIWLPVPRSQFSSLSFWSFRATSMAPGSFARSMNSTAVTFLTHGPGICKGGLETSGWVWSGEGPGFEGHCRTWGYVLRFSTSAARIGSRVLLLAGFFAKAPLDIVGSKPPNSAKPCAPHPEPRTLNTTKQKVPQERAAHW